MERLGIPGEDLPGVLDALRFIERYKTLPDFAVGRCVIVIGAGNTAIDAANAALRSAAQESTFSTGAASTRCPRSPLNTITPRWRVCGSTGWRSLSRSWRNTAVPLPCAFLRTHLTEADAKGRRRAEPIPNSEYEVACDMVVPALGQSRLTAMLPVLHQGGSIQVDRATGLTSNPKYYAGGDCINGGREVVECGWRTGKRAAIGILKQFGGVA
jgi:glutamate synthase (NADPH/NADH) small chain